MKKFMHQLDLFESEFGGNDYQNISNSFGADDLELVPDEFGQAIHRWATNQGFKINTLCLFSGAGGLDIGFHDSGFNVLECVELESKFVKSLEANKSRGKYFQNTSVVCIDIRDYEPHLEEKIDFIIGGPPCQSFSKAGIRAAGAKGTQDERGTLFEEYVRVLKKLQPKAFLFENVTGILSAEKGDAMRKITKAFRNVGYELSFMVLDAADYGVPQNRERLIMVGRLSGEFKFPAPTHGVDSNGKRPYYSAGKALTGLKNKKDLKSGITGRYGHFLDEIPPGLNYSYFTEKMGHPNPVFAWRSKFSDFLYKADPDLPVRTVKASGGQYTGPFHWKNRPFTTIELKRLQTFPDDYLIEGGAGTATKQIGNSVPPQFARILALAVLDQIFDVELPFEFQYLQKGQKPSFRKVKSQRTKYYRELAKQHISSIANIAEKKVQSRSYHGSIVKLSLKESKTPKKGFLKTKFTAQKSFWRFESGELTNFPTYRLLLTPSKGDVLFNDVRKVEFIGSTYNLNEHCLLWKAFERELIKNKIKADLVQLSGYYQYKSALKIDLEILREETPSESIDFKVLEAIFHDPFAATIRTLDEVSILYDVEPKELLKSFRRLKGIGFEIRNHNTNPVIPKDHFLIPYPFPSMNSLSLQVKESL